MKKNNTAEKAILSAKKISNALKEGTEKTLRDLLNEAVSNAIADEDESLENNEDSYEEEDVKTDDTLDVDADDAPVVDDENSDTEEEEGEEGLNTDDSVLDDADDDMADEDEFKVGDGEWDVTKGNGDDVLRVFNKMNDEDELAVVPDGDGRFSFEDGENEYVIELGPDADAESDNVDDSELDIEIENDGDDNEDEDADVELELTDEEPDGDAEFELDIDDDDEEPLQEDANFMVNDYQKNVFAKPFNMNEPAPNKSRQIDKGAPKGDERPYPHKSTDVMKECGEQSNEMPIEEGDSLASTDVKHMKKTKVAQHRPNAPEYSVRKVDSPLSEEKALKLINAAKQIQAENKLYKQSIDKIKESLREAAVLNVNLGRIVNLLVNETTTKDEKKSILERFNTVKTLQEGKTLYESIKRELNETKQSAPTVERQFVAESKSNLNETTFYASREKSPALDLMVRMDNLYKK